MSLLLTAMNAIVRGVKIQDQFTRILLEGSDELLDKGDCNARKRSAIHGIFESTQRRWTGQNTVDRIKPGGRNKERIFAEFEMIIAILIAATDPENALLDHRGNGMLHVGRMPMITQRVGELVEESCSLIHGAKKHHAGIRGDVPTRKISENFL
jgi:hypothetical protein